MTMVTRPAVPDSDPDVAVDWRLAELFLLRTGGLPIDVADELSFTETAEWACRVLAAEDALAAEGNALADVLAAAVARTLADDRHRRLLINMRRDVFNRRPVHGDTLAAVGDLLPPDEYERLLRWETEYRRGVALRAEGAAILAAETEARRDRLRGVAADTDLRQGIQLASPSLDRYLDSYLNAGRRPLSKRARRLERSLLEYLFRTACKTSPFSTLTSVNVGSLGEEGGRAVHADLAEGRRHGATRLNVAVLAGISALLLADPALRVDLPVRLTDGLRVDPDRVRYLRRQQPAGAGDPDAAVTLGALHERLFFLPMGKVLDDVLATGSDVAVPFGDLAERLAGAAGGRSPADVHDYLGHLLRLGLLTIPALQLDIHDPDPLGGYAAALRGLGRDWADTLADDLDRIGVLVARLSGAPVDTRRELLNTIRTAVEEIHGRLGAAATPPPRTLVYEDTTLEPGRVVADRRRWERELLPDLRRYARLLPAFDAHVVRRMVTTGFFRIRYGVGGVCDDFLSFAHEFHQDFFDNFNQRLMRQGRFDDGAFVGYDNWFKQPEIAAINDARVALAERMAAANAALPPGATELRLDDGFVDGVADRLPDTPGSLQPLSFFLQIAQGPVAREQDGPPTAVVNRAYSGLTLLFSRFAHLFDGRDPDGELAGRLRGVLAGCQPPGAVFAELKGGYDTTNLNLHPRVTSYELVCPGERSFRPADEQIPVSDLRVCHDPDSDRLVLRSRRLGREVIPVYLGFLLPMALPEIQQVLLNFSYTGMAQVDLWEGSGGGPDPDGILRRPRVRLGNLILARRSWQVPADDLPRAGTGQDQHEWYLSWRRWRLAHGLPRRAFVTARAAGGAAEKPADGSRRGEYKPMYVDFDSYLSLTVLEPVVRSGAGHLVFTEMLPDPDQLWVRTGRGRHVSELTIELDGIRARS